MNSPASLYISIMGDATSSQSFGSSPHHLAGSLRHELSMRRVAPLKLDTTSYQYRVQRALWSAYVVAAAPPSLRRGFQYSTSAQLQAWSRSIKLLRPEDDLLSLFQIVPMTVFGRCRVSFYIDATLSQLWSDYGISIDDGLRRDALDRERRGYRDARTVIALSQWAAASLSSEYGIDDDKIHVVPPGNNLSPDTVRRRKPRRFDASNALTLLFIGKEWQRKGLDIVVAAVESVNAVVEHPVRLEVIGVSKEDVPDEWNRYEWLRLHGFVDKSSDKELFIDIVHRCHLGILMSRAEAAGIALNEYVAMGLPVIASGVGGMSDVLISGASLVVHPRVEDLADALLGLVQNPSQVNEMADVLQQHTIDAGWGASARSVVDILKIR